MPVVTAITETALWQYGCQLACVRGNGILGWLLMRSEWEAIVREAFADWRSRCSWVVAWRVLSGSV